MSKVGNNIREGRIRKGYTQDQLAEVLHVTRQTVSSWETGRSEPDLETLSAISEALGVGLDELISLKTYIKGQMKYTIIAAVSGAITLAGLALKLFLEPALLLEQSRHYNAKPLFLFRYVAMPVFAAAFAVLVLSLLALDRDISFSGKRKKSFLIAGIVLAVPWVITAVPIILFDLDGLKLLIPWKFLIRETRFIYTLMLPFLSGLCLFLGINRTKAK